MKKLLSITSIALIIMACNEKPVNEKVEIDSTAQKVEAATHSEEMEAAPTQEISAQKDSIIPMDKKPAQTVDESAPKEVITHASNEQSKVDSIKAAKAKTKKK
ncbi:MAG: hypothetical protein NWS53_03600 [Salibacteraceae bacterium]|nr:hypothetical protein [Salibacteraceae bacterium]